MSQADQISLPLEPVSVSDAIDLAVADIEPYAKELGFNIDVTLSKGLPPILSHRTSLRRVIFNLIDNAIKFTRDQKQVVIKARRDEDRVRISVRDYGIGVRKSDIEQIFKLFGRAGEPTHAIPGSSGLGLYVAKNLSQALMSDLKVRPLGVGTSFYIRVPVAHQLSLFV
jgi:signal transduction histidine kinase